MLISALGLNRSLPFYDGDVNGKSGHDTTKCKVLGSPRPWPSTCCISGDLLLLLAIKCVLFPSFLVSLAHDSFLSWRCCSQLYHWTSLSTELPFLKGGQAVPIGAGKS